MFLINVLLPGGRVLHSIATDLKEARNRRDGVLKEIHGKEFDCLRLYPSKGYEVTIMKRHALGVEIVTLPQDVDKPTRTDSSIES